MTDTTYTSTVGPCDESECDGGDDGDTITCPGNDDHEYCDCEGDCGGSYCSCDEALACCSNEDAEALTFVPTGETYFSVTPCCNGVFTVDSNVNPEWDAEESRYYYISVTCS